MKCLCGKKELMLHNNIKCRLSIHDDNKVFDTKWKEHDFQTWIKQDIVNWAQNEHVRDSTHKRRSI
jgi:hypothetical protein